MADAAVNFVIELSSLSSGLTKLQRQHIYEQGELLPHVLMAEITRLVVKTTGRHEMPKWLQLLIEKLEAGLVSGNKEIENLVALSFVENLTGESAAIARLWCVMGRGLRKEVSIICGV